MFGPKLDARSYAILILAVVALLVGGNLIAQKARSTSESNEAIASATYAVAQATSEVAASNKEIAKAIESLADAVRDVSKQLGSDDEDEVANEAAATGSSDYYDDPNEGVFELNEKK